MQDVGAPSDPSTGSGLAPIQANVGTTGHQWNQDVTYPSNVTFTFAQNVSQVEQFVQFTLGNIDDILFGLINSFQVYQFNSIKITWGIDRIAAVGASPGRALVFAVAPYNRAFNVAANTTQQGLLSTLPGATWSFCNSFDNIDNTGAVDLQRIIHSHVTPQYQMESGGGENYSNRPLSIRNDDGLDDTIWRGFNCLLTRTSNAGATTFMVPTIVTINITFTGIRILRSVPALDLVGRDYMSAEVNEKRDGYFRPTDTIEGVGRVRMPPQSKRRATSSCYVTPKGKSKKNLCKESPLPSGNESKVVKPNSPKTRRHLKRCNQEVSPIYQGEGSSCELYRVPAVTRYLQARFRKEKQENQSRGNFENDQGGSQMFGDMQPLSPNDRESLQVSEIPSPSLLQD